MQTRGINYIQWNEFLGVQQQLWLGPEGTQGLQHPSALGISGYYFFFQGFYRLLLGVSNAFSSPWLCARATQGQEKTQPSWFSEPMRKTRRPRTRLEGCPHVSYLLRHGLGLGEHVDGERAVVLVAAPADADPVALVLHS